ncbi:MAG TPA: GNAT family N-acetyltransferase [Planctomycetaceae bacterium]|nr:GNAT family N-acetyltransferase [Planctomycetaceae bacterium]
MVTDVTDEVRCGGRPGGGSRLGTAPEADTGLDQELPELVVPPGRSRAVREALRVRRVRPDAGWEAFEPQRAHPANSRSFAQVHRRWGCRPLFLEAARNGERVGQWLVFRTRGRWNPLRTALFAFGAPQVRDDAPDLREAVFVAAVEWLVRRIRPQNLSVQSIALARGLSQSALAAAGFQHREKYWSYVNPTGDQEFLLSKFGSNHRINTRKALKLGYTWRSDVTPDEYLRLSRETYAAPESGGPSAELVRRIHGQMVPAGAAVISGAGVDGALRAASIVLFAGRTGYYLHGASTRAKDRNAATYLHFENMRWLHGRGVAEYDFGGAKVGDGHSDKALSISEFKRKFGGTLVEAWGGTWR